MLAVRLALSCAALAVLPRAQDRATPTPEAGRKAPAAQARPKIPTDRRDGDKLRLGLADCLLLGDTANVDLRLSRLQVLQAAQDVNVADAIFEPELFAEAEWARAESPPRNTFQPSVTSTIYRGSIGLRKRVVTGGTLELAFNPRYTDQKVNSTFAFPTKFYSGAVSFTLSQPLLRGAWTDYTLADLRAAKHEERARRSDQLRTRQTVLEQVVSAYYELVFARENWVVRYQGLELAREQLRNTEKKIELGDLAPLDIVADQADVSKKEEDLITAEVAILDAEDALRRLVLPFKEAEDWDVVILPTDDLGGQDPTLRIPPFEEALENARKHRPDLEASRRRVASATQDLLQSRRDLLPGLDLTAIYSSAAQANTFGQLQRDLTQSDFPAYVVRLGFSLPLGNLAAQSRYRKSKLAVEQAQSGLQVLLVDIHMGVREGVRALRTLEKRIAATRESVRLAVSNLDAEQKRLELGTQTQFEVQRRNQELEDARTRLIRDRLDYRMAWFHLLTAMGRMEPESKLPTSAPESTRAGGGKKPKK